MTPTIDGLHHVTAIASDPQRNHDFWVKVLGLRLVKKTVNFDDPSAYHLYYGDETGTPGTALTFFPWPHLPRGREGTGEASLTAFAIPEGATAFWLERFAARGVEHEPPVVRMGEETIVFGDPDGMKAALVVPAEPDGRAPWTTPEIGAEHAVRGFHGVSLTLAERAPTARLLTDLLGYQPAGREGDRHRYAVMQAIREQSAPLSAGNRLPQALTYPLFELQAVRPEFSLVRSCDLASAHKQLG
jgi:glyoxalase family protein